MAEMSSTASVATTEATLSSTPLEASERQSKAAEPRFCAVLGERLTVLAVSTASRKQDSCSRSASRTWTVTFPTLLVILTSILTAVPKTPSRNASLSNWAK